MTDSFRDFTYHKHIDIQHVTAKGFVVTLARDGEKQLGPAGRVEVRKVLGPSGTAWLPGLTDYRNKPPSEPALVYTGSLEQAQGYAQGLVDALGILMES